MQYFLHIVGARHGWFRGGWLRGWLRLLGRQNNYKREQEWQTKHCFSVTPKTRAYNAPMTHPVIRSQAELRDMQFAMRLSLAIGVLMLAAKGGAYMMTGSAAILSDAAESVVHVVAVGFAAFSMWLSTRPANEQFLYGYERIGFFSAGVEGALIIVAAITIIATAIRKWLEGLPLERLGSGALVVLGAAILNAALGWYLVRIGRRSRSLILEANGRHVLTDSWTSFGVVGGLMLVMWTGWKPFDPLFAIAVALNILWSGGRLLARCIGGLLDYADPDVGKRLRQALDQLSSELPVQYHGVRYHSTSYRLQVEVHLLYPYDMPIGEAHRIATTIEERLPEMIGEPAEVITHLESVEDHQHVHSASHYTGRPA